MNSWELLYDECQIRTQNAVSKDKTGNSLKTMGQTIGKYQQAWRFKSHVCKSRKEDRLYHFTTIEIAKAQKKDHLIYSKKMQKHQNMIRVFILLKHNSAIKGWKSIIPASLQIGQSVGITIT